MVSLAYVKDVIILGSCIPQVPGLPNAKEAIQQARENDLRGREKKGAGGKRLDVTKVKAMEQEYGHCAESWAFGLLCSL